MRRMVDFMTWGWVLVRRGSELVGSHFSSSTRSGKMAAPVNIGIRCMAEGYGNDFAEEI
jgi:hypothetical protein